eukprot:CAMPEP_0202863936 /NCGR_PEP_ID=MMETSP1391-20130828/4375_1 /ASSEMBLY_ACC=CAM_ASM_000867 /TAXON_ID=1034604 /ORGANISM="Chlamydomonas leiostraca, Strain SAG 11-49" /LENGTH=139 /DNA_ID=CAMNT_0049543627 /DNA_START=292 /DNA_END=711 /DNA_ORIENTATION=+
MNRAELMKMLKPELKEKARELRISPSGRKTDLVDRILQAAGPPACTPSAQAQPPHAPSSKQGAKPHAEEKYLGVAALSLLFGYGNDVDTVMVTGRSRKSVEAAIHQEADRDRYGGILSLRIYRVEADGKHVYVGGHSID